MKNTLMEIKSKNESNFDFNKLKNELDRRDNIIKLLLILIEEIKNRTCFKNPQLETLITKLKSRNYDGIDLNINKFGLSNLIDIEDLLPPFKERLNYVGVNDILFKSKYNNLTYDIFKYLNPKDLINLSLTCAIFRKICLSKHYWENLYFNEYDIFLFYDDKDTCEVVSNAKQVYQNQVKKKNDNGILNKPIESMESIERASFIEDRWENLNFQKKFIELKKINKSWESERPVVTTISTHECVTCLNLDSSKNELIYSAADGSASLFRLYSYRKIANDEDLYMQHHKQIKICDKISNFHGHGGSIWCLDRSDDVLFTGAYDKTIKLWQIRSGECISTIRAHSSWVSTIQYDKKFDILVSGSWDSTIKLWNLKTLQNSLTLTVENGNYIYCARSNLIDNEVIAGTLNKSIDIWDINTKSKSLVLSGHTDRINNIKIIDNLILSGSEDKQARLWDKRTGNCEILFSGHTKGITQIEFDNFNWRVFTSSYDKTIKIWDIRKNVELRTLVGHSDAVYSISFDQSRLISGSKDNSIRIWNFLN